MWFHKLLNGIMKAFCMAEPFAFLYLFMNATVKRLQLMSSTILRAEIYFDRFSGGFSRGFMNIMRLI